MKKNPWHLLFFSTLLFGFTTSCSENVKTPDLESLIGTWELEKIEPNKEEISESLINARITFSKNGEMTAYTLHEDSSGTIIERDTMIYRTDFNKLFLDEADESDYGSFQLKNNRLIIFEPATNIKAYFVRIRNK